MLAGAFNLHSCRFPPFSGSGDLLGPRSRPLEGRSRAQPLRSPDQANPLLNVINQTGPEGLPSDFAQPAQAKLTQADFLFDPGVGEFGNPGSLFINLSSFGCPWRIANS